MESASFNLFEQQTLVRKIVDDEANPSFFILNNADSHPNRGPGMVVFNVMENGQSRAIRVPISWVPIDAATQASKKAIVSSAEFQRALSAGAIMVFSHDEGRKIIGADEDSKAEYSRVMAIAQGVNGPAESDYSGINGESNAPEDPWINVSPMVKNAVDDVIHGNMTVAQFKSAMRRSARSVSALDRKYIDEKLPNHNNPLQQTAVPTMPVNGEVVTQS